MPKCSVLKCTNRSETKGVTMHRFPHSRPEVLEKWVRNIGRKDFKPSKTSCLCNVHFEDHCFSEGHHSVNHMNILKRDAVPTLFYLPLQSKNGTPLEIPTSNILGSAQHAFNRILKSAPLENHNYSIQNSQFIPQVKVQLAMSSRGRTFVKKEVVETSPSTVATASPIFVKTSSVISPDTAKKISNLEAENLMNTNVIKGLKKKVLNLESTIKSNQKTLKGKQQNIRRLNKRITTLLGEIKELEETADLAKHPEKMVKQHFSGVILEILLRLLKYDDKKPQKFQSTPALRSFASRFYGMSPMAYNFVYNTFKGGFPNPSLVRSWSTIEKKKTFAHIDEVISQTITVSQQEEIEESSTEMQPENDNPIPSTSDEGYPDLNQCSEMDVENRIETVDVAQSDNVAEGSYHPSVSKQFSSDLDELIKATLRGSYSDKSNKSDSPAYYVVHLTDPNYKNNDSESNDQERPRTEEQNTVIIDGESFTVDENNIVIVTTE